MVSPFAAALRAVQGLANINVRPGEQVLVLSSAAQDPVLHDALLAACDAAGAGDVIAITLVPSRRLTDYRHPAPALAAAATADLTIVATSMAFPRAYDDMTETILSNGKRLVLINNAPMPDFARGAARADAQFLLQETRRVAQAIGKAKTVRVRSAGGTDLTVGICRPCMVLTGYADDECGFGSYPSGEAMCSPAEGTAEGTFVADEFGQVVYISGSGPQIGLIDEPIRLHFEGGKLVGSEGGTKKRLLESILARADEHVVNLGELGIGTNPFARPIAHVENKFRLGTAHIALGDNHLIGWRGAETYGGTIVSGRHIDLVTGDVEVELDGKTIIKDGEIIL